MKKIFLIILIAITILPVSSRAQTGAGTYTLLEPLPCISGVSTGCTPGETQPTIDINSYILYIYKFAIAAAVFLAIVMIIWGGFLYITSEVPFIKSNGREKIESAIFGLIMVLSSYLILLTIDPRLVNIDSRIPPIIISDKDLNSVNAFKNDLVDSLNDINKLNQVEFGKISRKKDELAKEKTKVANMLENGTINDEEAEQMNYQIKNELAKLEGGRLALVGENIGANSYAQSLKNLMDPTATDEIASQYYASPGIENTGTTPRRINTPNLIQNQYNIQINKLIETNASADVIIKLEKQRDFYVNEVDANYRLKSITNPAFLPPQLEINEKRMKISDEEKTKVSGLPPEQYNAIIQDRINAINEKLGKKP